MWWSSLKKDVEGKFQRLHLTLKQSFGKVKQDTDKAAEWIEYLHKKTSYQDSLLTHYHHQIQQQSDQLITQKDQLEQQAEMIHQLAGELSDIPNNEEVKKIIDSHYSLEPLKLRLSKIEHRLDMLSIKSVPQHRHLQSHLEHLHSKVENLEHQKGTMREKLMKRITKNSKDYVKGVITSYISKFGDVAAHRLKEMVVDDQQLCSKSSFYRLIEEIERQGLVGVMRKGREKHYFAKVAPQK